MARTINAGENVGRGDLFKVDPRKIIVQPDLRARWANPGQSEVIALAESMLRHGQQHAITCRMNPGDKRIILEQGGTRLEAGLWLVKNRDKSWRIEVKIVDHNEEDGFAAAVAENRDRNETSAMDDAANMRRFRERYGWKDKQIKESLGCQSPHLRNLEVLLTLPKKVQQLVHQRKLAVSAAVLLAELSGPELSTALTEASASGKVDSQKVRQAARRTGQKVSRTLKDMKTLFIRLEKQEDMSDEVQVLSRGMLDFAAGTIDEQSLTAIIQNIVSGV